ncbi:MAG TPA: hypothetical protein VD884_20295 [Ohtaekwangia sp.]|nr:hypothetical protein [Ohtaekwangia sp.]
MKDVKEFFKDYASASLTGKANQVAAFYAQQFMATTKDNSATFENDQKFIAWLNSVFEFNKKFGLQKMEVKHVDSLSIGEYFYKVTVTWETVFAKRPDEKMNFNIHYILNRVDGNFKIVLYISEEDQEELMKSKGIL